MSMNAARASQVVQSLTGVAKKVYDVAPIAQRWSSGTIVGELFRLGHKVDKRTVDGVLNDLVEKGLLIEPKRGEFMRATIKVPTLPPPASALAPVVPTQAKPQMASIERPTLKPADLLDRMASISGKLRDLGRDASNLANDIDDAAIAAQQKIEGASADASKLRQLQQLLRSINADGG